MSGGVGPPPSHQGGNGQPLILKTDLLNLLNQLNLLNLLNQVIQLKWGVGEPLVTSLEYAV